MRNHACQFANNCAAYKLNRCQEGDTYSAETGLALCFAKKALGNKGGFNDVFKKYINEE